MTTTRISWIDNAKFIAITCVLLGHSFSLIKGDFCGYDDFNLFIVAFNMPLFALLSGFTSYKSLTRIYTVFDLFSYLNKIAWHLGVPTVIYTLIAMSIGYGMQLRWDRCILSTILLTIVCLLIYLLIFSKYSSKLEKARLFFPYLILPVCLANQSVWYFVYVLFSLFAAALSAYMSTKIRKNKRLLFCICFALISWVFAYFSPVYSTVEFYVPFIVGFIYSSYKGLTPPLSSNRIILCGIIISCGIIGFLSFINYYSVANQFYLFNLPQTVESDQFMIFVLRQISAISLSLAIVALVQILSKSYGYISIIGAMTFGIYPIHSEIIGITKNLLGKITMGHTGLDIMFVIATAVVLMLISVLLIRGIRKSKYCKLILLGE